eukprot:15361312-Ditylum_brightwellii.AAC.1
MRLVSDGAGKDESMLFGWSLRDDHNGILAECAGPAYLPFMQRHKWIIEGYADNEGLIKRVKQQVTYNYNYPSNTLDSDWDLLKQIATTMQTMEPIPKVSHVKGHQDDITPYNELDWASQQNVDTDKLAGNFLDQHAAQ